MREEDVNIQVKTESPEETVAKETDEVDSCLRDFQSFLLSGYDWKNGASAAKIND